jgi:hypothetical protein
MLENIVYTIRDQSAIFQLAILSSLAGVREYIMCCSLKNQALSSLIQGVFEVEVFLLTCDSMRCSKEF